MKPRIAVVTLAVCTALAPLSGCGSGDGTAAREPSASSDGPSTAAASRTPALGKGSEDPDDINGDGHRDLVVPVTVGGGGEDAPDERVGVVYGSAKGLAPSTRSVLGRGDLGLPAPGKQLLSPKNSVSAADVTTADLDGDGFPEFVTTVQGSMVSDGNISAPHTVPYVTWGGSTAKASATPVQLPQSASKLGIRSLVRGDFDGDGHHDLAGLAYNRSSMVVLYGPFSRSGAPARTDTSLPWADGELVADAIDPSGTPRATSLLLHAVNDGEQSGNTLYTARRGSRLSGSTRQLRSGNAHAFGDFDGDGRRDVAVGDNGGRNDEPGYETEPAEVDGSLAVYPGDGGAPVTYRLPEAPRSARTDYGPGGYMAADPDGDGRDGILVATYTGATLIDDTRRTTVLRNGPATADGRRIPAKWRHARPVGAADFDGDGTDELILNWGADPRFGFYGERATRWWITDGTTSGDRAAFTTTDFAPRSS